MDQADHRRSRVDPATRAPAKTIQQRRRYWPLWIVGLGLLAAMAVSGWQLWFAREAYYTDADTIKRPAAVAELRDVLWQPPKKLSELINTLHDDYEPRPSIDGQRLYLVRGKAGENADIYYCERTLDSWTDPVPLGRINSEFDDLGPEPTPDGRGLYFYSNRPDGSGGFDLWMAQRVEGGWQTPVNLGPLVNSEFNDYGPAIAPDGKTLFFASNRPRPNDTEGPDPDAWPATLREDLYYRDYDLYTAPLTDRGWGRAAPVQVLNTPHNEGSPTVSPFGDFMYFSSDRAGGAGGFDLYRAWIRHGEIEAPTNLGASVNTPANELDPGLTMGGYALYFSSDYPPQRVKPAKPNDYNLYYTTSREVFREYEVREATMNWGAFWEQVLPNLLWLLLSLLLLLLMFYLLRGEAYRKLSLLAKCLLMSLLMHMLLLFLLSFWGVSAAITEMMHRRGGIKVALLLASGSDDIAVQIRGNLVQFEMPTPSFVELAQQPPEIRIEQYNAAVLLEVQTDGLELRPRSGLDRLRRQLQVPREVHDFAEPMPEPAAQAQPRVEIDQTARMIRPRIATPASSSRIDATEPQMRAQAEPAVAFRVQRYIGIHLPALPVTPVEDALVDLRPASTHVAELREQERSLLGPRRAGAYADIKAPSIPARLDFPSTDGLVAEIPPLWKALQTSLPVDRPEQSETPEVATSFEPHVVAGTRRAVLLQPPSELEQDMVRLDPVVATSDKSSERSVVTFEEVPESTVAKLTDIAEFETLPIDIPRMTADQPALPKETNDESDRDVETALDLRPDEQLEAVERRQGDELLAQNDPEPARVSLPTRQTASADSHPTSLAGSLDLDYEAREHGLSRDRRMPPFATADIPKATILDLSLPTETTVPPNPYAQRREEERQELLDRMGGSEQTEQAVALALKWLAAHQSADGRWDAGNFDDECGRCRGRSKIKADVALTGLAMLCFLAVDHTHVHPGPYQTNVQRALEWLLDHQESNGDLRGGETMYSHGIATIALSEAYGMTADPELAQPVRLAVDFIYRARNKREGGWRYDPGQVGDTSVLGWQVMALKSAQSAGVAVPDEALEVAGRWLERVSQGSSGGLYAYQPGKKYTRSMTAEAMFVQQLLGRPRSGIKPASPAWRLRMQTSARFIAGQLPDWDDEPNTYLWYYATLALFQHQGEAWRKWNEALKEQLLEHQYKAGRTAGSWDTTDRWSRLGGRVYQTALCTLMLEVYYRYLPRYMQPRNGRVETRN